MDGFLEHQLICRACLRIVENKTQSFGYIEDVNGNLKDMIMCCVPEMDIYVSSQPIMCFPCIQLLITVYNFKTRCLNTETIIRSYIQRNNLIDYNHVNLSCVVQELIRLNSYFREMHNRNRHETEQPNAAPVGNQCNVPKNPYGMPGHPYGMPGNPEGMPGFHRNVLASPISQSGAPGNPNRMPSGAPGNPCNVPVSQSEPPGTQPGAPANPSNFPENRYSTPASQIGTLGILSSVSSNQSETPGSPREERGMPEDQAMERSEYLPLTREEINAAPASTANKDSTEVANYEAQPAEHNVSVTNEKPEKRLESRMRLVIKIDKGRVSLPYVRNEDSNEKENEQQDVEMKEKEVPIPENGSIMHPPPQHNKQELYECANCTFVTTHLNYLLAHNTVCIGENEKIDLKKCPHCPHVTNRQYALNKHINTMHTKAIWYSCDLCNYRSTDSSCLRRHKRNVHPEMTGTELCCHLCAYRCMTEYHLKKHLLKHEENTVLQCQFCSYSTKDRSNFRKHIFIHNPKAQDCEFCDYKCVSPYQMKVHLKKYHHGVGMEDIDCRSEVSISEVVEDITAAINETQTYIGHQAE